MKTTMSPVASSSDSRSASPLPLPVVEHDARAVRRGDLARAVARVAVDDEHLVGVRPDGVDDLADQAFFVPGGNDDGDRWQGKAGHRRGQRRQGKRAGDAGRSQDRRISPLRSMVYGLFTLTGSGPSGTSDGSAVRFRSGLDGPAAPTRSLACSASQIGLGTAILGANLRSPALPYKVTFVATYHCNFRCEMCNIWQKKSVNEMTPAGGGAVLHPLAAVPLGAPDGRRAVHAARSRRSRRRDSDELQVAVPAEFSDHRLVRRQDRRARRERCSSAASAG